MRVYYQDTDAGGVVYHAQYLSFMERARTELLNQAGIDLARFADRNRVLFMVHRISVTYHQPARLNELLSVSAEVVKMGRASLVFRWCSATGWNATPSFWSKPRSSSRWSTGIA